MSKLLAKTKELLRSSTTPIETIAHESGVNVYTLIRLKSYSAKSVPAVDTCEKLYEYLTGKSLEV